MLTARNTGPGTGAREGRCSAATARAHARSPWGRWPPGGSARHLPQRGASRVAQARQPHPHPWPSLQAQGRPGPCR
jgi:hypothetical protein